MKSKNFKNKEGDLATKQAKHTYTAVPWKFRDGRTFPSPAASQAPSPHFCRRPRRGELSAHGRLGWVPSPLRIREPMKFSSTFIKVQRSLVPSVASRKKKNWEHKFLLREKDLAWGPDLCLPWATPTYGLQPEHGGQRALRRVRGGGTVGSHRKRNQSNRPPGRISWGPGSDFLFSSGLPWSGANTTECAN